MKVEGTYTIDADRATVWAGLLAPETLARCIPGCQRFEPLGDDTYDVVLEAGVGSVSGTYSGSVVLRDKRYLESYRMLVEGTGAGGTLTGEAVLSFNQEGGETQIRIVGDAHVTGVVARVGQRLLGTASKILMNQFFACVKQQIEGR